MSLETLIPSLILFPWLGSILVWAMHDRNEKRIHMTASVVSIICALVSILLTFQIGNQKIVYYTFGAALGELSFSADAMGVILVLIANVIGSLAVIFSMDYMQGERNLSRYYAMILLFIGAMSGLVLTANIFIMFFFWEVTALCSYQLISFYNDDPNAVRGALKALLMTQFGGVGLLFAALMIFNQVHSFDLNVFTETAVNGDIEQGMLALIGFSLIIAAAAKSSQFPFFTWLPDAMEAPTPVSALIHAATMVNAGIYLLSRFFPAFAAVPAWKETVIWVGLIGILLTSILAITTYDLKRVLAYSTVSQLGYMFVAIGSGSVLAGQFHLLSHAIFKALLFLAAGAVIHACGTRDMRSMGGFFKRTPFVSTSFLIGALALTGIPILNGFWSKELILESVHKESSTLVLILMLISVGLTAIYTLRCFKMVFMGKNDYAHLHPSPPAMKTVLGILSIGALTSWIAISWFSESLKQTLPYHAIESLNVTEMAHHIFSDPITCFALGITTIGFLIAWFLPKKEFPESLLKLSANSFGFDSITRGVVQGIIASAERIRCIQTGILNWNIFGLMVGLLGVLIILFMGR